MKLPLGAKIGIFFGLLGGLAGLTVAVVVAPFIGIPMGIIMIVIFGGLYLKVFKPIFGNQALLQNGVAAPARILRVWDTGWTVNENPRIGMEVEVRPPNGRPWTAETSAIISRLQPHLFQAGTDITVRYDPRDPAKVVFAGLGHAAAGETPAEWEQKLRDIDQFNRDLTARGKEASAIVLEFNPMGVNVNGDNPAATLRLKVLPPHEEPFDAEASGVFARSGLHKYQPGKEIRVKYDPWAKDRVTVVGGVEEG